jgi:hypothetical protein
MLKRTRWFSVGAMAGAGAVMYTFVRWRETRDHFSPQGVAGTFVGSARSAGSGARRAASSIGITMREAVSEGRTAMSEAEARITADLERA